MSQIIKLLSEVTNTVAQVKENKKNSLEAAVALVNIEHRLSGLQDEIDQVETVDNSNQLISLASTVGRLTSDVEALKVASEASLLRPSWLPQFHYELNPLDPDQSWDEIIKKGQTIQKEYYFVGEKKWTARGQESPHGYGWFGTQSMPIITIACTAPEYEFMSTKRLPGRFRLWCPARNGSVLRFLSKIGPTIRDNWTNEAGIPYGFKTDAPIGIYVEPSVVVDEGFITRPFDQTIENVMIVGQNGTLPIYLADNQDRLTVRNCNILNHQGANVGIKHGPPIQTDLFNQDPMDNVYLADPRFINLQMEGPHSMDRPQAAIFATGSNIRISGLNLYGYLQGPYLHGGKNRYVEVQVNKSNTYDGRTPLKMDEVCGATLNKYEPESDIVLCTGADDAHYTPDLTKAPESIGTHKAGDAIYGG